MYASPTIRGDTNSTLIDGRLDSGRARTRAKRRFHARRRQGPKTIRRTLFALSMGSIRAEKLYRFAVDVGVLSHFVRFAIKTPQKQFNLE